MKNLYTLTIALFMVIQLIAQPVITKQRLYGGTGAEWNPHIALLKNGGFIMVIESISNASGNKSENNRDTTGLTSDYWVVKVNALGVIEWDKTYGGDDYDTPVSIAATRDNGCVVMGYSFSGISGDKTGAPRGPGSDLWIIKLDSLGNKIWDKTYGGNADEYDGCIKETNDGFVVGCLSYSGKSGDKTDISRGMADYWLLKLNKQGNKVWDKTYGGDKGDGLVSIDITAAGGYILGGTSLSGAYKEKSEASRGGQDYWVITVDKDGNKLWDKTFGTADEYENFEDLQTTKDGGYILGGFSLGNAGGDKTENSRGGYDYWIIKLDSSGNKLWDKTFGGSDNDQLYALEQTKDKGYILAGYSYSKASGDKTEPRRGVGGYNDYWVVKTDSLGQIEWEKTIGGSKNDQASDIKQYKQNEYLVAGLSASPKSGDKTLPNFDNYSDAWLVRLQVLPQNAIAETHIDIAAAEKSFSVYPNPAKDVLHINVDDKANFSLSDHSGNILLTKSINGNGVINIAHLPAGIYYLKDLKTNKAEKIIISR